MVVWPFVENARKPLSGSGLRSSDSSFSQDTIKKEKRMKKNPQDQICFHV
jgi:hypothetical protein